jgi:hypothetical protein
LLPQSRFGSELSVAVAAIKEKLTRRWFGDVRVRRILPNGGEKSLVLGLGCAKESAALATDVIVAL